MLSASDLEDNFLGSHFVYTKYDYSLLVTY
jgi:hypothetical protein